MIPTLQEMVHRLVGCCGRKSYAPLSHAFALSPALRTRQHSLGHGRLSHQDQGRSDQEQSNDETPRNEIEHSTLTD